MPICIVLLGAMIEIDGSTREKWEHNIELVNNKSVCVCQYTCMYKKYMIVQDI